MRIDSTNSFPQVNSTSVGASSGSKAVAPAATGATSAAAPAEPASGFSPTSDLKKLLDAVRETPDVRSEAVEEVSARLKSGELHTHEAAQDTAAAILDQGNTVQ